MKYHTFARNVPPPITYVWESHFIFAFIPEKAVQRKEIRLNLQIPVLPELQIIPHQTPTSSAL